MILMIWRIRTHTIGERGMRDTADILDLFVTLQRKDV